MENNSRGDPKIIFYSPPKEVFFLLAKNMISLQTYYHLMINNKHMITDNAMGSN